MAKRQKTEKFDMFRYVVQQRTGYALVAEYRFHRSRRWRFDYAIPHLRLAIEIDGGVWHYGRHNRPQGYLSDMEKFNAAAALGWVVMKFTPQQKFNTATLDAITAAIAERVAYTTSQKINE
jgi:very-short-patch-repair endonuclease